jgi:hypothetical protein
MTNPVIVDYLCPEILSIAEMKMEEGRYRKAK